MKKIKFILAAFAAVMISFGAFAQEDGNRDANGYVVKGPYLTNGGGSNWFVGVGGGFNTTFGKGITAFSEFKPANNWSAEAFVGKWFTPSVGARVGYKGVMTNFGYNAETYASEVFPSGEQLRFDYLHADFMWNVSNAFSGYKETRFWDIIPYAGAGFVGVSNGTPEKKWAYFALTPNFPVKGNTQPSRSLAVNAGVYNKLRLSNVVNLYIDLSILAADNPTGLTYVEDGAPVVTDDASIFCRPVYLPTATVGVVFNLGKKKNFDRFSSVGVYKAEYDAVVAELNELRNRPAEVKEVVKEVPVTKEVEVVKVNYVFDPHTVRFDIGSATLSDREKSLIESYVKGREVDEYTVIGSADSKTGSARRNEELCYSRADAVVEYLETLGKKAIIKTTLDVVDGVPEASRVALICVE